MGKVFLVGAGPGDPELLTRKAYRVLQGADIVLHDSLVSVEILRLIPPRAERIDVGKRCGHKFLTQEDINALLVAAAGKHKTVVRLKGGDPMLFGRAAEEIQALQEAAIEFEVIPGISAAFGAAASARVPLTDRALASSVLFTTFSRSPESQRILRNTLTLDTTVVIYMPGLQYSEVSQWLIEAGLPPETPCMVVSKATQAAQITELSTAAGLADLSPLPAPAILIVGRTAAPDAIVSLGGDWRGTSADQRLPELTSLVSPSLILRRPEDSVLEGPHPLSSQTRRTQ